MNLSKAGKVTRLMSAVAAGTTDQNSSSVDMSGYNAVQFVTAVGAITSSAVTSAHVASSSDDSTFNDLTGTSISIADSDDNQVTVHDIIYPLERYLRVEIDRGTANAVIDGVFAIQYNADIEPVTHDSSTVVGSELHVSPTEGTA